MSIDLLMLNISNRFRLISKIIENLWIFLYLTQWHIADLEIITKPAMGAGGRHIDEVASYHRKCLSLHRNALCTVNAFTYDMN